MWLWRNMLNIKWTYKIPNRVVLQLAEEERSLVAKMKERQKTWTGHVSRSGNLLQRKNTRKTNKRKNKNWNVVWPDRKKILCKPQKKSTILESVEKLDNEE